MCNINAMYKLFFGLIFFFCGLFKCTHAQSSGDKCFEEGGKIAVPNLCGYYLECHGGIYVIKQCRFGERFDMVDNECIWTGTLLSGCHYGCHFKHFKPVKGSNNKYVYCENGVMKQGSCKGYFDRLVKQCAPINSFYEGKTELHSGEYLIFADDPNSGLIAKDELISNFLGIGRLTTTTLEEELTSLPTSVISRTGFPEYERSRSIFPSTEEISTFSSSERLVTTFPLTEEISTFSSSERHITTFPFTDEISTFPSTETSFSTFPPTFEVITFSSTEVPTTFPPSTKPQPSTTSKTSSDSTTLPPTFSTLASTTQAPACTKDGQKKVFKKGDCKDYLECDSNRWVKKSCGWFFDFDINKLECRWSWWAKC